MVRVARWMMATGSLLAAVSIGSTESRAQEAGWRFTAVAAQSSFSSIVRDTTTSSNESYDLEPRPSFGMLADKGVGRVRIGLAVSYLVTHLRVTSSLVSIADQEFQFSRWQAAALATVRLFGVGTGGAGLALSAGPALAVWTPTGEDSRTRFAGVATLLFNAPITPKWNLLATGGGAVSGSPMNSNDIPPEFVATTLWAWQVGLGVQYGL